MNNNDIEVYFVGKTNKNKAVRITKVVYDQSIGKQNLAKFNILIGRDKWYRKNSSIVYFDAFDEALEEAEKMVVGNKEESSLSLLKEFYRYHTEGFGFSELNILIGKTKNLLES